MIYLKTRDGRCLLVISPGHLKYLRQGELVYTPDKHVAVAFVPDEDWMLARLSETLDRDEFDAAKFDEIHAEAMKQPEVEKTDRPMIRVYPPSDSNIN